MNRYAIAFAAIGFIPNLAAADSDFAECRKMLSATLMDRVQVTSTVDAKSATAQQYCDSYSSNSADKFSIGIPDILNATNDSKDALSKAMCNTDTSSDSINASLNLLITRLPTGLTNAVTQCLKYAGNGLTVSNTMSSSRLHNDTLNIDLSLQTRTGTNASVNIDKIIYQGNIVCTDSRGYFDQNGAAVGDAADSKKISVTHDDGEVITCIAKPMEGASDRIPGGSITVATSAGGVYGEIPPVDKINYSYGTRIDTLETGIKILGGEVAAQTFVASPHRDDGATCFKNQSVQICFGLAKMDIYSGDQGHRYLQKQISFPQSFDGDPIVIRTIELNDNVAGNAAGNNLIAPAIYKEQVYEEKKGDGLAFSVGAFKGQTDSAQWYMRWIAIGQPKN